MRLCNCSRRRTGSTAPIFMAAMCKRSWRRSNRRRALLRPTIAEDPCGGAELVPPRRVDGDDAGMHRDAGGTAGTGLEKDAHELCRRSLRALKAYLRVYPFSSRGRYPLLRDVSSGPREKSCCPSPVDTWSALRRPRRIATDAARIRLLFAAATEDLRVASTPARHDQRSMNSAAALVSSRTFT